MKNGEYFLMVTFSKGDGMLLSNEQWSFIEQLLANFARMRYGTEESALHVQRQLQTLYPTIQWHESHWRVFAAIIAERYDETIDVTLLIRWLSEQRLCVPLTDQWLRETSLLKK